MARLSGLWCHRKSNGNASMIPSTNDKLIMKILTALFAISALPLLVGCASTTKPIVLAPVGPSPAGPVTAPASEKGYLLVYSARQRREPVNISGEVFVAGNIGSILEDDMIYDLAHSGYDLFTFDGKLLRHVRNSRGMNDETPTRVALPAGSYRIKAEARDYGEVTVPILIKPGELTAVYLQRDGAPTASQFERDELVWLGNRPVGRSAHFDPKDIVSDQPVGRN